METRELVENYHWIHFVLIGIITVVVFFLTKYYIRIATEENGGFDKKEFDRLVLYVMMFTFVALVVLNHDVEIYLIALLTYWLGREKVGEINIGKK